jgi:hypothetical protein
LAVEVADLLAEVVDRLFVELLLLVESALGLHDESVHVLVFLLEFSDFGDNI